MFTDREMHMCVSILVISEGCDDFFSLNMHNSQMHIWDHNKNTSFHISDLH